MTDLPDDPQPTDPSTGTSADDPLADDDQGAALDRAAGSIREAKDAEGTVAANDDITAEDEDRAGEHSDNPDGGGGLP